MCVCVCACVCICRLIAEQYDIKSKVKLSGFQSQLEAS